MWAKKTNRKSEIKQSLVTSAPTNLFQRLQIHFADFKIRAFTLDANETGGNGAFGDFVQQFAVDDGFDIVARADRDVRVPFADGVFIRFAPQCDWRVGVLAQGQMFLAFRAGHHE
jgi:hypothetical protein